MPDLSGGYSVVESVKPDQIRVSMRLDDSFPLLEETAPPFETTLLPEDYGVFVVDLDSLKLSNGIPETPTPSQRKFNLMSSIRKISGHTAFGWAQAIGQGSMCGYGVYVMSSTGDMTGLGWLVAGGVGVVRQVAFAMRAKVPFIKDLDERVNVVMFGAAAAISLVPQLLAEIATGNEAGILAASAGITAYALRSVPELFLMAAKSWDKAIDWGKNKFFKDRLIGPELSYFFKKSHDYDLLMDRVVDNIQKFLYEHKETTFVTTQLPPGILFYRAYQQFQAGLPSFDKSLADGLIATSPGLAFLFGSIFYLWGEAQLREEYKAEKAAKGDAIQSRSLFGRIFNYAVRLDTPLKLNAIDAISGITDETRAVENEKKRVESVGSLIDEIVDDVKIDENTKVVIFSGSGISVASGLSTLTQSLSNVKTRTVGTGKHIARASDLRKPEKREKVREDFNLKRQIILEHSPQPNPAHEAIVALEGAFGDECVSATQNYDGLLKMAGSRSIELRGSIRNDFCMACENTCESIHAVTNETCCGSCNSTGEMHHDIALFTDRVRRNEVVTDALKECDLFICAGSSQKYSPMSEYVKIAHKNGAKTVEINVAETEATQKYDVFLKGKAEEVLPRLAIRLIQERERAIALKPPYSFSEPCVSCSYSEWDAT